MPAARILALLAFANFVIGMGAFVVIGVLSPIGAAFTLSPSEAGRTMTAYALVYAVASPLLVSATGRFDRRSVLLAGLTLFLAGAAAAAMASSFAWLLVARALMAVGGGLVTPVGASIAVAAVEPSARGRALATVFGGLTLAQVIGVPTGAWLGYAYGWRTAFAGVALLTLACLALLAVLTPRKIVVPVASLRMLGEVLTTPRQMLAVAFTALFIGGLYCLYTYLGPYLETRYGLTRDGVTTVLALFGLGAVAGNALGGRLTDRIGASNTLFILSCAQIVIMPALTLGRFDLVAGAAAIVVWSIFAWSFMAAQQTRLAGLDPTRTPILFALNAAAIYVGGSLGSLAGGEVLRALGMDWTGVAGAVMVAGALASLIVVSRWREPSASPSERASPAGQG